jgi:hypothetical protein
MDVKFTKKLIWFGERTIRNHINDKPLVAFVSKQNVRMSDQLKEYLAQNPGKNVKFDPKTDVPFYESLMAKDKK